MREAQIYIKKQKKESGGVSFLIWRVITPPVGGCKHFTAYVI